MCRSLNRLIVFSMVFLLVVQVETALAAITWTGNIDPSNPALWNSSTDGYVGKTLDGSLTISGDSGLESRFGYIAYDAGVTGEVTITGADATWSCSPFLYVGYNGDATLTINSGGVLSSETGFMAFNAGSTSDVAVSGAGSRWTVFSDVDVGYKGSGTLAISDGGRVSDAIGYVGRDSGSVGEVTITGAGSSWVNSGTLYVARYGTGTIEVSEGASLTSGIGNIAYSSGSMGEVAISGADSRWTVISGLYVGRGGNGKLTVDGGGLVWNIPSGHIGYDSSSIGETTVTGLSSMWLNNSDLTVGGYGTGTLTISDGGLVGVAGTLTIDSDTDGDSFINMSTGGILALHGNVGGSLSQFLSSIVGTGAIRYWDDSISDWADLTGAVPGLDFSLAYIDDVNSGMYDYTLLRVGSSSAIPGDANVDGHVDEMDAQVLAEHWRQPGGWRQGDFDHDFFVGPRDASIMAANWGHGSSEDNAVPEPGELVILWLGVSILLARRRQRS